MNGFRDALQTLPEAVFADLLESEDAYVLVFDMPGVTEDALEVTVTGRHMAIEARREKAVPEGFWFRQEDRSLFLDVDLPLPPDAASEETTARLADGVLEVTVPKTASDVTEVPIEG
ncbi:MAG: Hsp20/alpha crystallin family protein [Halanaeroarchaeum sp.]